MVTYLLHPELKYRSFDSTIIKRKDIIPYTATINNIFTKKSQKIQLLPKSAILNDVFESAKTETIIQKQPKTKVSSYTLRRVKDCHFQLKILKIRSWLKIYKPQ